MIYYSNAKINIGLRVVSKRFDGYHNINSFFYPISLSDILEIVPAKRYGKINVSYSGLIQSIENDLIVRAYDLLSKNHKIPSIDVHLHKNIPIGSGLGGGSSNAAHILKILNTLFSLNLGIDELISYSKKIGSDCPFFLINSCSLISGTGDVIKPLRFRLNFDFIVILKPDDILSTNEVFTNFRLTKNIKPYEKNDINNLDLIKNDLETTSEKICPEIRDCKKVLKKMGALYISMTGSGSAVYGFFNKKPIIPERIKYWSWTCEL